MSASLLLTLKLFLLGLCVPVANAAALPNLIYVLAGVFEMNREAFED